MNSHFFRSALFDFHISWLFFSLLFLLRHPLSFSSTVPILCYISDLFPSVLLLVFHRLFSLSLNGHENKEGYNDNDKGGDNNKL